MASCAVCGTGLREGATHCTTCGTPTGGRAAPAAPVSSPPPRESETSWIDPPSPFGGETSWESSGPAQSGSSAEPAHPSKRVTAVAVAAILVVIVGLIAVVAVPRLFPSFDAQKYVGTWAYTGNTTAKVVIARQGGGFTITFIGATGARQSLPGTISDKHLVIDYAALPQGKIVEKLAESIGAKLSFSYRKSDDRLLLTGSNPSQGSFTLVMERASS